MTLAAVMFAEKEAIGAIKETVTQWPRTHEKRGRSLTWARTCDSNSVEEVKLEQMRPRVFYKIVKTGLRRRSSV